MLSIICNLFWYSFKFEQFSQKNIVLPAALHFWYSICYKKLKKYFSVSSILVIKSEESIPFGFDNSVFWVFLLTNMCPYHILLFFGLIAFLFSGRWLEFFDEHNKVPSFLYKFLRKRYSFLDSSSMILNFQ